MSSETIALSRGEILSESKSLKLTKPIKKIGSRDVYQCKLNENAEHNRGKIEARKLSDC
jgi:hypothetical protein